ncbi:MAG: AAA family ATPase, partial [Gemmatimonadota bacterium]
MQTSISVPTGAENAVTSVGLERLHLRNFRNFRDLRCEFPPAGALIVGPNGAGKSNLLEAIYYLEIFRSFRGAPDRELVRFDEDVFRIEAGLSGEAGPSELAAAFESIDRVGPCKATIHVEEVEDVRVARRKQVIERAKILLNKVLEEGKMEGESIADSCSSA